MVTMDTQRMFRDLHDLLFEPFRAALIYREHEDRYANDQRVMIESIAEVLIHDMPGLRNRVQEIIDEHVGEEPQLRSPRHNVYAPEAMKEMVRDIGRKAWERRYVGPLEVELKVQTSTVSLHRLRHPENFSQLTYE